MPWASIPASASSTPTSATAARSWPTVSSRRAQPHLQRKGRETVTEPTDDIPLAAAIKRLRDELITAAQEGVGKDVRFRLGPIQLDLEVAATNTGGGEAGIQFWMITIG